MKVPPIRIYADTSVYGGILDDEFQAASSAFFAAVLRQEVQLVGSALIGFELEVAPQSIQDLYQRVLPMMEDCELTSEVNDLAQAYLRARILGLASRTNAVHVAAATVSRCSLIVSWNFKHIVNYRRIPLFNGVNLANGYQPLAIYSPLEVVSDDKS